MNQLTLSRDTIKYIAMFTMFLNHFNLAVLHNNAPYSMLLEDIGYFTAVTMCYFLVEGYHYTRSKKRYAQRMLIFAAISQVPYVLALEIYQFNMLFTLLLCLGVLRVMEQENSPGRGIKIVGLVILSMFFDWGILAPVFTYMFEKSRGSRRETAQSFAAAAAMFALLNFLMYVETEPFATALLWSVCSCLGIIVSGIVILYFYDGTRSSEQSGTTQSIGKLQRKPHVFSKWFFYAFYPAHLLVLALVKFLWL